MNEARDSPARRKQFLVICTVMAGMFAHSIMTAGAFNSIDIKEGIFPGGFFVYKFAKRYIFIIGLDCIMYLLFVAESSLMGAASSSFPCITHVLL